MLLLPTPVRQTAHGNLPELCRRSSTIPQIMIFVFPAFTLSPFSSIASFQVKSLLTHSSSDSVMVTSHWHRGPPRGPQSRTCMTCMTRLQAKWWRAAGWVLSLGNISPFNVPLANTDMSSHIGIHPPGQSHNPLGPTVFSEPTRWPSKALDQTPSPGLWKPCSLLLAARYCLTTKIMTAVPLPETKPNWESSTDTNCLRRLSAILSRTFMICSVSLRPW